MIHRESGKGTLENKTKLLFVFFNLGVEVVFVLSQGKTKSVV